MCVCVCVYVCMHVVCVCVCVCVFNEAIIPHITVFTCHFQQSASFKSVDMSEQTFCMEPGFHGLLGEMVSGLIYTTGMLYAQA